MISKTYHTKPLAILRTDDQQLHAIQQGEDYFLSSADSIHFFAEKDTVDELGQLKKEFHSNKVCLYEKKTIVFFLIYELHTHDFFFFYNNDSFFPP